ncbi:exopolysaccharide biosynthesis protein [Liquorilactobacillus satsumensis DSM 16230 = JCM 12392]|uniref:Exopolysaccharide biosynthesis protein n=2 Tax=Liquorilactobacillus satsumensis TaxID=259059 RepID=A0A0R1UVS1_9LACO|nr:exopolysaccharide biosynthesis protein [Liquorilactobacillus satsumensis DSM 16230 = JCM 12392]
MLMMADFFVKTSAPVSELPQNDRPKMFLFGTPSYTNMGDQAVSLAIRKYFELEFPQYQFIEIMDYDTHAGIKAVKEIINARDIVGYTGGGNLGSLYTDIEEGRREVFKTFTHNLTISFPQSIHFEKNDYGEKELELSQAAYASNPNLVLFARDAQSFRRMQKAFDNHVRFTPDMVLFLEPRILKLKRQGALFVLRHDGEKVLTESFITTLKDVLAKEGPVERTDTVLENPAKITPVTRERLFEEILEKIASQEVIVSDRFHAMVFSVLTQTPCLLFGNSYGKGKHAYYDWLENVKWIQYTDETDLGRITTQIDDLKKAPVHDFELRANFKDLDRLLQAHTAKFN